LFNLSCLINKKKFYRYLIEDKIGSRKAKDLKNLSLSEFVASVGARTVAPGGGCVAALVASLGSSLTCMTSLLSYGNRKFEKVDSQIRRIIPPLYKAYHELVDLIDQDAAAFNSYVVYFNFYNFSIRLLKFFICC
jgi:glutamate formiminotransferase/formiminotetrahydrofolate cyclodeaminase